MRQRRTEGILGGRALAERSISGILPSLATRLAGPLQVLPHALFECARGVLVAGPLDPLGQPEMTPSANRSSVQTPPSHESDCRPTRRRCLERVATRHPERLPAPANAPSPGVTGYRRISCGSDSSSPSIMAGLFSSVTGSRSANRSVFINEPSMTCVGVLSASGTGTVGVGGGLGT
jgi:hypothetical protein